MVKHQPEYDEAIERAEHNFRAADGLEMVQKCPYIFSSNMADAYWISAFFLYHSGKKPTILHKSRGMTWIAEIPRVGTVVAIVEKPDQRNGVNYTIAPMI